MVLAPGAETFEPSAFAGGSTLQKIRDTACRVFKEVFQS